MATVEAECMVEPLSSKTAQENGVVYSQAYGDQPALIPFIHDFVAVTRIDAEPLPHNVEDLTE